MYDSVPASLPREFFYTLSKLQGSMAKNLVKVSADRVTASSGNITNIRLPIGMLCDLRSTALWFDVDISGTAPCIPARYASSFIKRMAISINNTTVQQIEDYNLIYNLLADHNNKALSKGIGGENLDNSVIWGEPAGSGTKQVALTGTNAMLASTTNQTGLKFCINNFLGLIGSASTSVLPTDRCGEVVLSITWENSAGVLGGTAETTAPTYSDSKYEVKDIYLTMESYSFSDDSYYTSIGNKDLMFGFTDYICTRFADTDKATNVNVTSYISANSIDWLAITCVAPQSAPKKMIAWGSEGDGDGSAGKEVINVYQYMSDPVAYKNNLDVTNNGDGFFNTAYFQRDLQNLESVQFSINNKALNYAPLNPQETFQNNLCCLGYEGVDASRNGLIDTCVSLKHYYKYYGAGFQSLSLIDKDQFNISGLSSAGSSASINAVVKFNATSTYSITPVLIAKLSKVLHIKAGRQISAE